MALERISVPVQNKLKHDLLLKLFIIFNALLLNGPDGVLRGLKQVFTLMKKISFQKLDSKTNLLFLVFLGICVLVDAFSVLHKLDIGNVLFRKLFPIFTYLSILLYLLRVYFFKNVFQWNSSGFAAKINSPSGLKKKFAQIKSIDYGPSAVVITDTNGKVDTLNLENIHPVSKSKLTEVLKSNVN
ncbi:hypothetical protein [Chryseobacterium sp. A301]